ncbi:helix-turn-helix domain-containing protein [Candidatus Stoquefichus sp. SB1]|jgi:putative transcriptional regulator|uniref:helix-turn-helix domain-containing protein n=1 Tax=Candidatus Stoquefichus sp. SB1 TaxID=1658109 RepID=UPI00067F6C40|nr:helix-turn-helix domain-containing protein [Candidatus Stoquefichus sp. SB1]
MKISYAPFWKTLKQKGLNQYVLINKMGVRNSLVHKLRHDLDIRLTTLADLCEKLECRIEDIVEVVDDNHS